MLNYGIKMKRRKYYECKIYVGSVSFNRNEEFTQDQIELFCGQVQEGYEYTVPIRITPTTYISDTSYNEKGWEIAAIDYPKLPYNHRQIRGWMRHLAEALILKFKQHTICVVDTDHIIMLENDSVLTTYKERIV